VRLLLDKGADLNESSGPIGTALQAAAVKGHKQIVQLLLDKGAALDERHTLQVASAKVYEQFIKLLLPWRQH